MPPNSVIEWMIGQNIAPPKESRRDVLTVAVSTDDEADTDTISVTYPRMVRTSRITAKKVRFRAPRKSALKTHSSSYMGYRSTSEDDRISAKKRSRLLAIPPKVKASPEVSFSEDDTQVEQSSDAAAIYTDEDAEPDLDPHPTCPCTPCIKGRKILAKKGKQPNGNRKHMATSDEKTKTQKGDCAKKKQGEKKEKAGKSTSKRKNKEENEAYVFKDDSSDPEVESECGFESEPEHKIEKKSSQKNGQKGKKGVKASQGSKKPKGDGKSDRQVEESQNKSPKKPPQTASNSGSPGLNTSPQTPYPPPEMRQPNLIMPIRAQVVQVEHTVEDTLQDPRPNAFMDNEHGICRVYHGPSWGNPFGSLYPRRTGPDPPALPAGTPHPLNNPFYYGMMDPSMQQQMQTFLPPQGTPVLPGMFNPATPPQAAQGKSHTQNQCRPGPNTPSPTDRYAPPQQDGPAVGLSGLPVMTPEQIAARFSEPRSHPSPQAQQNWGDNVGPPTQVQVQNGFDRQAWVDGGRSPQGSGGANGQGWGGENNLPSQSCGGNSGGGFHGSQNGNHGWGSQQGSQRSGGGSQGGNGASGWGNNSTSNSNNHGNQAGNGGSGGGWGNIASNNNSGNRQQTSQTGGWGAGNAGSRHSSPREGGGSGWGNNGKDAGPRGSARGGSGHDCNGPPQGGSQHPSRRNSPHQSSFGHQRGSPSRGSPQNHMPGSWNSTPGSNRGNWNNNQYGPPSHNSPHNSYRSSPHNGGFGGHSASRPGSRHNSPHNSPHSSPNNQGGNGPGSWGQGSGSGDANMNWGNGQQQNNGGGNWSGAPAWGDPTAAQSTHGAALTGW
ncbi:hypothetical protein GQ53DRAFT_806884 [Thozetella sp. PMI_491]|nr:hypothetical protein GQ53DRAFT_806884 [Thozetella sp. PMI_491]